MVTSPAGIGARLLERVRSLPWWLQDLLLAIVVCEADLVTAIFAESPPGPVGEVPTWAAVAVVLVITAPLVLRRHQPVLVMIVTGFGAGVALSLGISVQALAPAVALYSVAAYSDLRETVISTSIFLVISVATVASSGELYAIYSNVLIVVGVAVLGRLIRSHREQAWTLAERAQELERSREEQARLAVKTERARIAREMHDVLAHSTSVMVVQATGAKRLVRRRPDAAEEALDVIETTGRESLADLRRMLGLLRRDDEDEVEAEEATNRPQPGLADLHALVEEFADGGLPVELRAAGTMPDTVDAAISLSAYRIVQEALTNALKHAGAARVTVDVRGYPDRLEVEVLDDGGRGSATDRLRRPDGADGRLHSAGSGYGLLGMRERARLVGGRLETGPRPGGGFRVAGVFPLDGAEAPTTELARVEAG